MLVAPSILAANLLNLETELQEIEGAGADWHHIDVMDGHFVPNLSFGLPLIRSIKKVSQIPLDVHIMVSNPDSVASDYASAGADSVTFHVEAATHSHRIIESLHKKSCKAGVAINPGTPVGILKPLLSSVDLVLVMSVNPGFGGQKFIPETYKKLEELGELLQTVKSQPVVQVDGGVGSENINHLRGLGVDCVVAGSAIYGANDREKVIKAMKE